MSARRCTTLTSIAVAVGIAAAVSAAAGRAETAGVARERPRGVVEDCSRISGFGGSLRDFKLSGNLVVGPLAVLQAGHTLAFVEAVGGNKLFVLVKGGHRVTLELPARARRRAGFVFGPYPDGQVHFRDARRVVTFVPCGYGERTGPIGGWPVSGWVGGLLAGSAHCVPLRVWVDDDRSPRRAVIPFGVSNCG